MTLNQLYSLNEDELSIALHIVNKIFPIDIPNLEFTPANLVWIKKDALNKRLLDAFPHIKLEAHGVYSSLLNKLSIQHEIRYEQPPATPLPPIVESNITSSNSPQEVTSSV